MAAGAALLAACSVVVATTAATAGAASKAKVVSITANPYGQLKYTSSSLSTTAGKVEIVFTNNSPLSHDVVLVNSKNKILGQTPIFSGGTKSFTVTLTAGKYIYYCSVPGHREAGMQGTLTVS
jgi:plastocyanin